MLRLPEAERAQRAWCESEIHYNHIHEKDPLFSTNLRETFMSLSHRRHRSEMCSVHSFLPCAALLTSFPLSPGTFSSSAFCPHAQRYTRYVSKHCEDLLRALKSLLKASTHIDIAQIYASITADVRGLRQPQFTPATGEVTLTSIHLCDNTNHPSHHSQLYNTSDLLPIHSHRNS